MQKRHARWIAGFAVAGTVVLTGAAAGAAADVRGPQEISPATCAALAADLASTLAEAAKGLAATPPDLSGVTSLVAQANKLQDAFKSLNCTSVPIPATPSLPVPSVPSVPTPSLPAVPDKPSATAVPSVPPVPGAPPSIPALPSTPALPTLSAVSSSMPGLASIPGLGNIPGLPAMSQ